MTQQLSMFDLFEPPPSPIARQPYVEPIRRTVMGRAYGGAYEFKVNEDWPAARANGLGKLLDENPFSYCYLMRWKLDFTGEGSPPQRNAWFAWDRRDPRGNGRGDPGFRWLDRVDGRQAEMPL